ncbi:uncharacterized protein LOC143819214 [Paroedura picta]|uniref:uncharacterized protein LOC143819214 n=1 Tax=Paroedura picta TaxID=143630 RepID=UPI0040561691
MFEHSPTGLISRSSTANRELVFPSTSAQMTRNYFSLGEGGQGLVSSMQSTENPGHPITQDRKTATVKEKGEERRQADILNSFMERISCSSFRCLISSLLIEGFPGSD